MQRTCANDWCRQSFDVSDADLAFYEKVSPVIGGKTFSIPPPSQCPDCRQQRRAAFRNERNLRRSTCAICKKPTLSMYRPDLPYVTCCHGCWWSDRMDGTAFGKMFDANRSFFDQFKDLSLIVPRMAVLNPQNENSDFCNFADWNKNGYMLINSNSNEDSFYSTILLESKNCMDCFWVKSCELCYECVNVERSYNVRYSEECFECRDSLFLAECRGCSQCIGCVNLRQKSLHIFNEPVSEETFHKTRKELSSRRGLEKFREQFTSFLASQPRTALHIQQSENSTGDHVIRCKNVHDSFDVYDTIDCSYCDTVMIIKDCADCHCAVNAELSYENTSFNGYASSFTAFCRSPRNVYYSWDCHSCHDCFGCIGLKNQEYCILNRQYTKAEYEELISKIIEHMRKTPLRSRDGSYAGHEWGEFFPMNVSPFAYNETVAQEYYPLQENEVRERGWAWWELTDERSKVHRIIPGSDIPDAIELTTDDILHSAVECAVTRRPYRIIRQELQFYRQMQLPIPTLHPDERHRRRFALRNPRRVWNRACGKCGKEIETTYAPERRENVYCESCYLKEVY